MRTSLPLVTVLLVGASGLSSQEEAARKTAGRYLGQEPPRTKPVLFAPGILSTAADESLIGILNGGTEIWYTIQTSHNVYEHKAVRMVNSRWTEPRPLAVAERYGAVGLQVANDGRRVYFAARKSLSRDETAGDWDIWYVERRGDTWSKPINPGRAVNSDADEYHPCPTARGTLYFTSNRQGGAGSRDIYCAERSGDGYSECFNLGDAVNTPSTEWEAFVSDDESYMVFSSNVGSQDRDRFDLFISFKDPRGDWSPPRRMGPEVNTANTEMDWLVSPDGLYAFFTSCRTYPEAEERGYGNGRGDIYWVDASIIETYRDHVQQ